jgi:hypothetical protein
MRSFLVKAYFSCPTVETVVNAETEIEAQIQALRLLREKLAQATNVARVEIRSEFTPNAEKASHLLHR